MIEKLNTKLNTIQKLNKNNNKLLVSFSSTISHKHVLHWS